jgi:hypothetical protein
MDCQISMWEFHDGQAMLDVRCKMGSSDSEQGQMIAKYGHQPLGNTKGRICLN